MHVPDRFLRVAGPLIARESAARPDPALDFALDVVVRAASRRGLRSLLADIRRAIDTGELPDSWPIIRVPRPVEDQDDPGPTWYT